MVVQILEFPIVHLRQERLGYQLLVCLLQLARWCRCPELLKHPGLQGRPDCLQVDPVLYQECPRGLSAALPLMEFLAKKGH